MLICPDYQTESRSAGVSTPVSHSRSRIEISVPRQAILGLAVGLPSSCRTVRTVLGQEF
jgi:hypothetical protein